MSLINCPECSKEVSNAASSCIHCGYPLVKKSGLTFEEQMIFMGYTEPEEKDDIDFSVDKEKFLCCPYCYSKKLTPMKKGFSAGRAAAGILTLGLYGTIAGSIGSNNVHMFCNGCGKKFKSKDAIQLTKSEQKYFKKNPL